MPIQLYKDELNMTTSVPNRFIDLLMPGANGEFVKVYLYLLRCLSRAGDSCTVSGIADALNHTEADVMRALRYWERAKVLALESDENEICGIRFLQLSNPSPAGQDCEAAPVPGELHSSNPHRPGIEINSFSLNTDTRHGISVTESDTVRDSLMSGFDSERDNHAPVTDQSQGSSLTGRNAARRNIIPGTDSNHDNRLSVSDSAPAHEPEPIPCNEFFDADRPLPPHSADEVLRETQTRTARNTVTAPVKPAVRKEYSSDEIRSFLDDESVSQLFIIIETYLKHPLNATDTNTVLFWLDGLHFPEDLVIYLVESCISKGHTSFHYMDAVARAWREKNITTVDQAKEESAHHSEIFYGIRKAFGISGRDFGDAEASMIQKWTREYAFHLSIILEACRRTITQTHEPSFNYADRILSEWHKRGVHTLDDIQALDKDFNASKKTRRNAPASKAVLKKNSFTNFDQRDYDYDELEKMLLTTTI